jgi:hypothetical protein
VAGGAAAGEHYVHQRRLARAGGRNGRAAGGSIERAGLPRRG